MRLIDADALMAQFDIWDECDELFVQSIRTEIEHAPTIEPDRKRGKWNAYYHSDTDISFSCNMCGYSAPFDMMAGEVFQKRWNFCPNCGADMREGGRE